MKEIQKKIGRTSTREDKRLRTNKRQVYHMEYIW